MSLYDLLFSAEALVNTILILMMVLTVLLLVWVNIERRKKEELEEEVEEKELEVERKIGDVHLSQASLLKNEHKQQVGQIEDKLNQRIEELIAEKQRLQDDNDMKTMELVNEKQQLVKTHQSQLTELKEKHSQEIDKLNQEIVGLKVRGSDSNLSESAPEIVLEELQAVAKKSLEDEKRQLELEKQQVEMFRKQFIATLHSQTDSGGHQLIIGSQHADLVKSSFEEATKELTLFCSEVSPQGVEEINSVLDRCLERGVRIDLVLGTNSFLNESRLHLIELVQLLKKAERHSNFRIRSRFQVAQEGLICDERWAVLTSSHWLSEKDDDDVGIQIQEHSTLVALKEIFMKSINQADFLTIITDEIKVVGKKDNEILIKPVKFQRTIRLQSRFIEQIVQELQTYREKKSPVRLIIAERSDGRVDYVGHRPVNS